MLSAAVHSGRLPRDKSRREAFLLRSIFVGLVSMTCLPSVAYVLRGPTPKNGMMRIICSVCLMIVATALPLAARTTSNGGANGGKASKSQSVASANASKPAATAPAAPSVTVPVKQPKGSQLWVKAESRADRYASRDVQVAHQAAPATPRPRAQLSRSIVTPNGCLARVTAYWPSEGDYYTRHSLSSTGVRLHDGHCAVDPSIIPYGSVVDISGVGKFLAVDTGTAVGRADRGASGWAHVGRAQCHRGRPFFR